MPLPVEGSNVLALKLFVENLTQMRSPAPGVALDFTDTGTAPVEASALNVTAGIVTGVF